MFGVEFIPGMDLVLELLLLPPRAAWLWLFADRELVELDADRRGRA